MVSIVVLLATVCLCQGQHHPENTDIFSTGGKIESCCDNAPLIKEVKQLRKELKNIANMIKKIAEKLNITKKKGCPSGFTDVPDAGSCYRLLNKHLDWNEANRACRSTASGAHLTAITSVVKQNAIAKFLNGKLSTSDVCKDPNDEYSQWGAPVIWTSGQREDPKRCETPFKWKTGKGSEIRFTYTNWHKGEPNNCLTENENCVQLIAGNNYTWNNLDCNSKSACVLCEI